VEGRHTEISEGYIVTFPWNDGIKPRKALRINAYQPGKEPRTFLI
jgi:hypothetical protein